MFLLKILMFQNVAALFEMGQGWVLQNGAVPFQNGADSKMGHNVSLLFNSAACSAILLNFRISLNSNVHEYLGALIRGITVSRLATYNRFY